MANDDWRQEYLDRAEKLCLELAKEKAELESKLSSTEKRLYIALSGLRRVAWNDPPLNGPGVFAYSLAAERSFYNAGGYEEHRRLCEHVPNEAAITRQCTLCGDIPEAPK